MKHPCFLIASNYLPLHSFAQFQLTQDIKNVNLCAYQRTFRLDSSQKDDWIFYFNSLENFISTWRRTETSIISIVTIHFCREKFAEMDFAWTFPKRSAEEGRFLTWDPWFVSREHSVFTENKLGQWRFSSARTTVSRYHLILIKFSPERLDKFTSDSRKQV